MAVGDLYQFWCACEKYPDHVVGCGLISHGAVLKLVETEGSENTPHDNPLFELILGSFSGDPDVSSAHFCPPRDTAGVDRGSIEIFTGVNEMGVLRSVYVDWASVAPLNQETDNV